MELVHVQAKVHTLFFWDIGTAHRGRLEFHHKNHTQQLTVKVAGAAFAQVHQQNLLVVHNVAQVKGRFSLANNITHHGVAQERPELTYEPGGDFSSVIGTLRSWILLGPELQHLLIFDVLNLLFQIIWVTEQFWNIYQCTAGWISHHGQSGIAEHIIVAWAHDSLIIWIVELAQHI